MYSWRYDPQIEYRQMGNPALRGNPARRDYFPLLADLTKFLFLRWHLLRLIQIFEFSLGFCTVTMTVNRLDIMHASVADGGLSGKFAFFLILPDQSGAAARHDTRNAIVDAD